MPDLSSEVMLQIFDDVFSEDPFPGWPARLVSCALLRKSWLPILDLFWIKLGPFGWLTEVSAQFYCPITNRLQQMKDPIWAKKIEEFDYSAINVRLREELKFDFTRAFLSIAKHLKVLVLPEDLFYEVKDLVSLMDNLTNVEICGIRTDTYPLPSIQEIQSTLYGCEILLKLHLTQSKPRKRRPR